MIGNSPEDADEMLLNEDRDEDDEYCSSVDVDELDGNATVLDETDETEEDDTKRLVLELLLDSIASVDDEDEAEETELELVENWLARTPTSSKVMPLE